ncbi:MAG: cyclic pyranopterin monophosphate synthase MoaC [Treponema sp.]|nr:cyclic pyranopterin monophosphate synthase MoaC [Treponema sp.]
MPTDQLTHFDQAGNAIIVDVSQKQITHRTATAQGEIMVSKQIYDMIEEGTIKKGDVLGVARIAGIMGLKQTSNLIPLCHPLPITNCSIEFKKHYDNNADAGIITVYCTATCDGKTGVEMEALTGTSVTLLSIYDMCKAVDKRMVIKNIHLVSKSGGKSGDFFFDEQH